MVVDAEVLGDRADAGAAVEHRATDPSDDLVNEDHKRVRNAHASEKTTEGSKSFRPRPPLSRTRNAPASRQPRTRCGRAHRDIEDAKDNQNREALHRAREPEPEAES